jgi:hypothetical protein
MTERTITKEQLIDILDDAILNHTTTDFILEKVFPPMFKPKEGEAIWSSVLGDSYNLRVFSHMENNEYVCFEDSHEENRFYYKYARCQTPTQKGE